ncbi:MAG: sulfatase-like hydrolase/transferase [Burkholderiaceae bacterium]
MITMIDDAVGEIMAALQANGQDGNTIVVFTSDHGDVFGDHGLMLKSSMHYQGVVRVPFVFAGPGIAAGQSDSLVSSLDIGRTLTALAGLGGVFGSQGLDLTPVLDNPAHELREQILIEEEQMFRDPDTGRSVNFRTVITQQARLTVRSRRPLLGELYDFTADPLETVNRYDDPGARELRAEMMDRLVEAMMLHSTPNRRPWALA